jgi:hypothetical protein
MAHVETHVWGPSWGMSARTRASPAASSPRTRIARRMPASPVGTSSKASGSCP